MLDIDLLMGEAQGGGLSAAEGLLNLLGEAVEVHVKSF